MNDEILHRLNQHNKGSLALWYKVLEGELPQALCECVTPAAFTNGKIETSAAKRFEADRDFAHWRLEGQGLLPAAIK